MTNGIRANDSRRIISHRCLDSDFPVAPALHNPWTKMEPGFMALSIYCAQMASKWSCVLNSRPRQLKDMTVEVYYDQFFTWKKKLEELNYIGDEESYIDDFLLGLKMDIAVGVWRYKWKPLTLYGAFRRAEIEETLLSGKEFSTTFIEMPSQYPSEYESEFPMLEASLSTTSFEVTVKGKVNDDPKSAINPVVEVLQNDEWLELEENAGSIFGELAVQNVARKVFAEMSEPILKEDLLGSEGAKIVHCMFDEMPHLESVNSAEFLGAEDISDENIDDVLDAPNFVATQEGVLENEAVQMLENLIDPFQAGLLSSLMTNISYAPYLIEYEAFSLVFEDLIWLFEEDEQSSPLTPEVVNDAHLLFSEMPILPSNEQTIEYVNTEHLMFLFVGRPNSTGYIMGTRCDKLIKSAPTKIFIAPKTRNQMVDVSINPGLNDDYWFSQIPSFIFDPGISSWLYKGCGFTKPNGEKHNFEKMPNNLNVELLVGKVLMFVFDPGLCAFFVNILEDKDVFEGVGKGMISMDTTVVIWDMKMSYYIDYFIMDYSLDSETICNIIVSRSSSGKLFTPSSRAVLFLELVVRTQNRNLVMALFEEGFKRMYGDMDSFGGNSDVKSTQECGSERLLYAFAIMFVSLALSWLLMRLISIGGNARDSHHLSCWSSVLNLVKIRMEQVCYYENGCLVSNSFFNKALMECFEIICNKGVRGWSSVVPHAASRSNILLYTTKKSWQVENLKDTRELSNKKGFKYVFKKLEWESLSIDLIPQPDMFIDTSIAYSPKGSNMKDEDRAKRRFFGGERSIEGLFGEAHITTQRTELNSPLGLMVQLHIAENVYPVLSEPVLRAILRLFTGLYLCLNRVEVDPKSQSRSSEAVCRSLVSIIVDHIFRYIKDDEFQLELLMQPLSFSRTSVSDRENNEYLTQIMVDGFILRFDTTEKAHHSLIIVAENFVRDGHGDFIIQCAVEKAHHSVIVVAENFVWDPGNIHFTTLRTRRLLRGRICHESSLILEKIIIYLFTVLTVNNCDVIYYSLRRG